MGYHVVSHICINISEKLSASIFEVQLPWKWQHKATYNLSTRCHIPEDANIPRLHSETPELQGLTWEQMYLFLSFTKIIRTEEAVWQIVEASLHNTQCFTLSLKLE